MKDRFPSDTILRYKHKLGQKTHSTTAKMRTSRKLL